MKMFKQKSLIRALPILILIFITSGCGQISGDANYTLSGNESINRNLFIFAQNATLEEGSAVDGSVFMLCCNLKVEGEVQGNVFLLTGNLWIDTDADVNGRAAVFTGNLTR